MKCCNFKIECSIKKIPILFHIRLGTSTFSITTLNIITLSLLRHVLIVLTVKPSVFMLRVIMLIVVVLIIIKQRAVMFSVESLSRTEPKSCVSKVFNFKLFSSGS